LRHVGFITLCYGRENVHLNILYEILSLHRPQLDRSTWIPPIVKPISARCCLYCSPGLHRGSYSLCHLPECPLSSANEMLVPGAEVLLIREEWSVTLTQHRRSLFALRPLGLKSRFSISGRRSRESKRSIWLCVLCRSFKLSLYHRLNPYGHCPLMFLNVFTGGESPGHPVSVSEQSYHHIAGVAIRLRMGQHPCQLFTHFTSTNDWHDHMEHHFTRTYQSTAGTLSQHERCAGEFSNECPRALRYQNR
jgi:hypothetical protein